MAWFKKIRRGVWTFPSIPWWAWWLIWIAIILIVAVLLRVNFSIGSNGIHLQQNLVH